MNKICNPSRIPWVTIGAGGLGLGLRLWLYAAAVDEKGLLTEGHVAGALSFVLTAVFFLWLILTVRSTTGRTRKLSTPLPAAVGCGVAAVAVANGGIRSWAAANSLLGLIALICCVAGSAALLYQALCRVTKRRPAPYGVLAVIVPYIFLLISHFRIWSKEPQVQAFFFPLMAGIFLLLHAFFKAQFQLFGKGYRKYLYASQSALFLSCLSIQGELAFFYAAMAVWLATDFIRLKEETL